MINQSQAWHKLVKEQQRLNAIHLTELLKDSQRETDFSCQINHLLFDYSKNRIDQSTLQALLELAKEANLTQHINDLFAGKPVNFTEDRPALHTQLRTAKSSKEISAVHQQIRHISDRIRHQQWLGYDDQSITDVVNIGIGGSDLGPALVTEALSAYQSKDIHIHFISNVDPEPLARLFAILNPATTVFIVASKSFTTQETLMNAESARQWLLAHTDEAAISRHFIAATAKPEKALAFGISEENILPFWDWVGGRYSLWSAIGLPIAIAIGMDQFQQLLAGAAAIDQHFQTAEFSQNIPVLMALLSIWYINFWQAHTQAVMPYAENLAKLSSYIQQLDMESNGKSVSREGKIVDYHTAPIIWGTTGTNSQHASHQLLHQGTLLVPIDFIMACRSHGDLVGHQDALFANCLAQAQALAQGKTEQQAYDELMAAKVEPAIAKNLAKHKVIPGNKPSNLLLFDEFTPFTIGMLIAIYEHKVFTQGIIWQINSFDQWGVELGKQLGNGFLEKIQHKDKSSIALRYYQEHNN